MEAVATQPAERQFDIRPYLQANRLGRWVYTRREHGAADDEQPVPYVRQIQATREGEGNLRERRFLPLQSYLDVWWDVTTQPATPPKRPVAPMKERYAFFFELTDPMPTIPVELDLSEPIETSTRLRYYWHDGRPLSEGSLTRTVEIEGFEDVKSPGGEFEECLRVRLDLRIRFGWGLAVDWTSYFWLSREAGEVRRVQRFSGWLWIFPFGSAHEYTLMSHLPAGEEALLPVAPKWQHGAILFDRGLPRPRIGGMVVDYARSR
jgi:hypothetical protein